MKKLCAAATVLFFAATPAMADSHEYTISIKDHKFTPDTVEIPAGAKVKLLVKNLDKTAEEFESHDLKREKVIAGGAEATINIGPLKAGEYKFEGEYHEDTAKGKIVVK